MERLGCHIRESNQARSSFKEQFDILLKMLVYSHEAEYEVTAKSCLTSKNEEE